MTDIGLIAYGLDRNLSGIGRYTSELGAALAETGLEFTWLAAGNTLNQANLVTLAGSRLLPALLTLGQLQIAWQARRRSLRLIHDPTGTVPHSLANSGRVVTIHDVIPYIYPSSSTTLDRLIYRYWLPARVRSLDAIITDSHCSKEDIMNHLPVDHEKVFVVPIGKNRRYRPLDAAEVRPVLARLRIPTPYILYVGAIAARKNLPRLLEAFSALNRQLPDYRMVIAGARGWQSGPVFEAVRRLGLEDSVHFTGYVEEKDLPALYNGASLFVFPSLYEGFGLPVLEAMACGTPVVTSNTSSLPEVAGDAVLLVDPEDTEAIVAAMHRLLTDEALAADLRHKGLERASQFNWERTARETIKVYEKVLGNSILD